MAEHREKLLLLVGPGRDRHHDALRELVGGGRARGDQHGPAHAEGADERARHLAVGWEAQAEHQVGGAEMAHEVGEGQPAGERPARRRGRPPPPTPRGAAGDRGRRPPPGGARDARAAAGPARASRGGAPWWPWPGRARSPGARPRAGRARAAPPRATAADPAGGRGDAADEGAVARAAAAPRARSRPRSGRPRPGSAPARGRSAGNSAGSRSPPSARATWRATKVPRSPWARRISRRYDARSPRSTVSCSTRWCRLHSWRTTTPGSRSARAIDERVVGRVAEVVDVEIGRGRLRRGVDFEALPHRRVDASGVLGDEEHVGVGEERGDGFDHVVRHARGRGRQRAPDADAQARRLIGATPSGDR